MEAVCWAPTPVRLSLSDTASKRASFFSSGQEGSHSGKLGLGEMVLLDQSKAVRAPSLLLGEQHGKEAQELRLEGLCDLESVASCRRHFLKMKGQDASWLWRFTLCLSADNHHGGGV